MLIRVLFKNFLSFADGTEFNLLPNPKRKRFPKHIYTKEPIPVLKCSALYGANGAGKSNILKGIDMLKYLATEKNFMQHADFYDHRFRLRENNRNAPISIGIEFSNEGTVFYYHIEVKEHRIELEELYVRSGKENEEHPIFVAKHNVTHRELVVYNEDGTQNDAYIDSKISSLLEKNPTASILSLNDEYPVIPSTFADTAFDWFDKKLHMLPMGFTIKTIINILDTEKRLTGFINQTLQEMRIGVDQIEVKTTRMQDIFSDNSAKNKAIKEKLLEGLGDKKLGIAFGGNNRPVFSICKEKGEDVAKELIFKQRGPKNHTADMDITCQSEGTVALLSKFPLLFDLIHKDHVFLVDEIEASLHPQVVERFLELFLGNNRTKGQLIFTTHEVYLLNQKKLLRPDEVWFVEKNEGCSKVYSLNDFKEHGTIDIEKGYLSGRYGAIPFLGNDSLLHD